MSVMITVSRQMASEGCKIAAEVAAMLGFRLVDREIIHRAAEEAGVPKIALQEIAFEGRRDLADRILRAVNAMPPVPSTAETWRRETAASVRRPFGGIFSPAVPSFTVTLKDYIDMVGMVIRDLAREGNVVIAGRGGQVLLRDMPRALHVQIVAPYQQRVIVLAERDGISQEEAARRVKASDQARRDYMRRYHRVDWLDPILYDMVINTNKIPISLAASMIVDAFRQLQAPDHG
jgi:cytidylate kinase